MARDVILKIKLEPDRKTSAEFDALAKKAVDAQERINKIRTSGAAQQMKADRDAVREFERIQKNRQKVVADFYRHQQREAKAAATAQARSDRMLAETMGRERERLAKKRAADEAKERKAAENARIRAAREAARAEEKAARDAVNAQIREERRLDAERHRLHVRHRQRQLRTARENRKSRMAEMFSEATGLLGDGSVGVAGGGGRRGRGGGMLGGMAGRGGKIDRSAQVANFLYGVNLPGSDRLINPVISALQKSSFGSAAMSGIGSIVASVGAIAGPATIALGAIASLGQAFSFARTGKFIGTDYLAQSGMVDPGRFLGRLSGSMGTRALSRQRDLETQITGRELERQQRESLGGLESERRVGLAATREEFAQQRLGMRLEAAGAGASPLAIQLQRESIQAAIKLEQAEAKKAQSTAAYNAAMGRILDLRGKEVELIKQGAAMDSQRAMEAIGREKKRRAIVESFRTLRDGERTALADSADNLAAIAEAESEIRKEKEKQATLDKQSVEREDYKRKLAIMGVGLREVGRNYEEEILADRIAQAAAAERINSLEQQRLGLIGRQATLARELKAEQQSVMDAMLSTAERFGQASPIEQAKMLAAQRKAREAVEQTAEGRQLLARRREIAGMAPVAELTDEQKRFAFGRTVAEQEFETPQQRRLAAQYRAQQTQAEEYRRAQAEMRQIEQRLGALAGQNLTRKERESLRTLGTPFATGAARGGDIAAAERAGFFRSGAVSEQQQQLRKVQQQLQLAVAVEAKVQPNYTINLDASAAANFMAGQVVSELDQRLRVMQADVNRQVQEGFTQAMEQIARETQSSKERNRAARGG